MHISAMLTSLPLGFEEAVRQAASLGFTYVDVVALAERPAAHLDALAETGLLVSCAAVGRGLPQGCTLDAEEPALREAALEECKRQVSDAARLGATHCYVVPGTDTSAAALARLAETCALLADHSAGRMVKLCVEHSPGRALASVAATLAWLEQPGMEQVSLLLDVGHCLISKETPAEAVERAGRRLGYVHFDDNDGHGDLHWPLLKGRLTREMLESLMAALRRQEYRGGLTLELNPSNPDPVAALREGMMILESGQDEPRP